MEVDILKILVWAFVPVIFGGIIGLFVKTWEDLTK